MSRNNFEELIDSVEISLLKKNVLKKRFVRLLMNEKYRALRITFLYYLCHTIVSVGSLIVPALLSIQYTDSATVKTSNPESFSYMIYWTTWFVSLFVTTFNALLTLFKIDKKYLYLNTNKELFASEGWQYLQLSGRYSGFFTPGAQATHDNQFIFFCHRIEKIRLHEIEDEYSRFHEQASATTGIQSTLSVVPEKKSQFNPPTPINPQGNQIIKAEVNELFESDDDELQKNTEINMKSSSPAESPKKQSTIVDDSQSEAGKVSVYINMPEAFKTA